jgi:transglutaminase-like putative cysteine protease
MVLTVSHTTTYLYREPVSICHTEVHLTPRSGLNQHLISHQLDVRPEPAFSVSRADYFGNQITCFSIHEPHQTLTIEARSVVDLLPEEPPPAGLTPPWEVVRADVRHASGNTSGEEAFRASEFVFGSPLVKTGPALASYAMSSFPPGRTLLESGMDLCHRIFTEFRYDKRATTISTPVDEVLKSRGGVCQDFAHLMIACLRSLGLPARYVSGYLRSREGTVGAEASHAWCALFCPGFGWLDFDPTNDVMPQGDHVTLAVGRDYFDVTPVKGVAIGGGDQIVNVAVEVLPSSPSA